VNEREVMDTGSAEQVSDAMGGYDEHFPVARYVAV
jgi:hypothetical protein